MAAHATITAPAFSSTDPEDGGRMRRLYALRRAAAATIADMTASLGRGWSEADFNRACAQLWSLDEAILAERPGGLADLRIQAAVVREHVAVGDFVQEQVIALLDNIDAMAA